MNVLQRFRLALKFSMLPADLLVKWTAKLIDKIEAEVGHSLGVISKRDLSKLDPKRLRKVSRALFAFYLSSQGLDEVQLRAMLALLEDEVRRAVPFLKRPADPSI